MVKNLELPYIKPYTELKRVHPMIKHLFSGLTFPNSCTSESFIKIKSNLDFFDTSSWSLKRPFVTFFEAPQRNKINISVNIFSSYGIRPERFNRAKSMNSRSAEIFAIILAYVDRLSNILSIVDYKIPFDTIQV